MIKLTYKRVGNMTYNVFLDGVCVGLVWRTRHGWSAENNSGVIVVEDYPGSRGVAAGVLSRSN